MLVLTREGLNLGCSKGFHVAVTESTQAILVGRPTVKLVPHQADEEGSDEEEVEEEEEEEEEDDDEGGGERDRTDFCGQTSPGQKDQRDCQILIFC